MILQLLKLEWKQFFRSASFGKSIGLKLLMGFFALYLLVIFLSLGIGGYFILRKEFPEKDPFILVNQFMIFAIISDLIFRYLMQKIPVMDIKPMLILPIKKSKLVNFVLSKSVFSFFNSSTIFLYIPFAIVLIKEGYDLTGVIAWTFFMCMLVFALNFLNFLVNKSNLALGVLVILLTGLWVTYYYEFFDVTALFGKLFYGVYENPILAVLGLILAVVLYILNFKQLFKIVYLDGAIKGKVEEVKSVNLSFIDKFGDVAPFIKNDIRLIWRNKRTRAVFFMSFFFLLFGLIFFTVDTYKDSEIWQLYGSVFLTGGFAMNYGQFVPAWDSEHYRMLMTQNFSYRKFLESKLFLMTIMTIVLFILSTPYIYFGLNVYLLILAGFFFNLGFTPMVMLYMGAFNKKRIDLSASGFGNTQGTSAAQFIVLIPVLAFPMLIYATVNYFLGFNAAIITIAAVGIITFLIRNQLMNFIEKKYQQKKYITIHGFKQAE